MAPKRSGAGSLSDLVRFQRRTGEFDDYGNVTTGPWTDMFTEPCRLTPKLGGEPVMAQRLVKRQPYILTVRSSSRTRAVAMDWRAVNARTGAVYNLTTGIDPDGRNAWIELLVIEGEPS